MPIFPPKNDRASWLKGPSSRCSIMPLKARRPWRLILLGAPGVGKGTQAALLTSRLGACHLSTGDALRAARANPDCKNTQEIAVALDLMGRGELVPDNLMLNLINNRSRCVNCPGGFLFDGYPRTLEQAQSLQNLLDENQHPLDAVINYILPEDELALRLAGRRVCHYCDALYHVTARPPLRNDLCDNCGNKLIRREDDHPETIRIRIKNYEKYTRPVVAFYGNLGLLHTISANGAPEDVLERTLDVIEFASATV